MAKTRSLWHRITLLPRVALVSALALAFGLLATKVGTAQTGSQLFAVAEFAVAAGPGNQSNGAVSGRWVVWQDQGDSRRVHGRNVDTGQEFSFLGGDGLLWPVDVRDDLMVATETSFDPTVGQFARYGVFSYHLPDGARSIIVPLKGGDTPISISAPRTDGNTVVWAETSEANRVFAYDLASRRLVTVTDKALGFGGPIVSGQKVVWRDQRNTAPAAAEADIYVYDLAAGQERRLTDQPEQVSEPAVSGSDAIWLVNRGGSGALVGYDFSARSRSTILRLPQPFGGVLPVDLGGGVAVWSAPGRNGLDIFGYDLQQKQQFIISQAIGDQIMPRVSQGKVVWTDTRNSGVGKYEGDADVYGARLESGPAPVPDEIGVPQAVDGKIEIVWPHGGAPVSEADQANIGAWLFQQGSGDLAPCQWNPTVRLWRALNNNPAALVATGRRLARYYPSAGSLAVPTWEFNDVDVSPARDPQNKLYFFVSVDGTPGSYNVWSHGVDARTYAPRQDVPAGVAPPGDTIDAKIEIVWPHDNAPVQQAKLVNVGVSLFAPGTLLAVPASWDGTVRLFRSLNNDVSRQVAVGQKRIVASPTGSYPVWDFNDVDVSAATDPTNKYYFTVAVDGLATHSNVWAHGADARTYFPRIDTPAKACR